MEFVKRKYDSLVGFFVNKQNEVSEERRCTKGEIYFDWIYKVFSWDDPSLTLIVLLICNFLFWFVVYFQLKLLGMTFLTLLCGFLWDSYFETKDLSQYQTEHYKSFQEICLYIKDVALNLKMLRKESPSSFCLTLSITFLFASFIARNISGYILSYLALLLVFFGPLGFKMLPEEYQNFFKGLSNSLRNIRDGVLHEEDLMPPISNVDLDFLLADKTNDSATNSYASSISAMPSYLDIAQDGIEEDDFLPTKELKREMLTPGDLSSDSDCDKDIRFDGVNLNDSSSDEEKLRKGLKFDQNIETPPALSGILTNIAALGTNLVANVYKNAISTGAVERKNSSSDSEFEIINAEDTKE